MNKFQIGDRVKYLNSVGIIIVATVYNYQNLGMDNRIWYQLDNDDTTQIGGKYSGRTEEYLSYVGDMTLERRQANNTQVIAGEADCGCVYHAEDGIPCEHDKALAANSLPLNMLYNELTPLNPTMLGEVFRRKLNGSG